MANLPQPVRPGSVRRRPALRPGLVRAAVSPTAAAAVAVGAGIGVADHSVVLAVILAALGWSGRMAAAVGGRRRRARGARPRPAELDPWSVPEPWRSLVEQAMAVQSRFDRTVQEWPDGPIRDHLADLQPRVWAQVAALGATARRGAAADGWDGARRRPAGPPVEELSAELRGLQEQRRSGPPGAGGTDADGVGAAALDRREEALAAQLRARRQAEELSAAVQDRLRAAVAKLDGAVSDLLGPGSVGPPGTGPLASALDALSDEITSLGAAIAETAAAPPDPARS